MKSAREMHELTNKVIDTFRLMDSILNHAERNTRQSPFFQNDYFIPKNEQLNFDYDILMTQLLKLGYFTTIEKYNNNTDYHGYVNIKWENEFEPKGFLEIDGVKYSCFYEDGIYSKKEIERKTIDNL